MRRLTRDQRDEVYLHGAQKVTELPFRAPEMIEAFGEVSLVGEREANDLEARLEEIGPELEERNDPLDEVAVPWPRVEPVGVEAKLVADLGPFEVRALRRRR